MYHSQELNKIYISMIENIIILINSLLSFIIYLLK